MKIERTTITLTKVTTDLGALDDVEPFEPDEAKPHPFLTVNDMRALIGLEPLDDATLEPKQD